MAIYTIAQLVKNPPAMQETLVQFLGREDLLEKGGLPTPVFLGFPCGSAGKESACDVGDLGSVTGLGRSPGEGKGYPLQYFGLEKSMDCIVHGVTKSQTEQLSLLSLHFHSLLQYFLKKTKKNLQTLNLYEEQSRREEPLRVSTVGFPRTACQRGSILC